MIDFAKPEVIAAVSSAVAAIASGFIAWRQHEWNKNHHLASVKPLLAEFLELRDSTNGFSYLITNKGLGPAEIIDYMIYWGDRKLKRTDAEVVVRGLFDDRFIVLYGEISKGYALSVSEQFAPVTIKLKEPSHYSEETYTHPPAVIIEKALGELVRNFRIEIKYKSVLSSEIQSFVTSPMESLLSQFS